MNREESILMIIAAFGILLCGLTYATTYNW